MDDKITLVYPLIAVLLERVRKTFGSTIAPQRDLTVTKARNDFIVELDLTFGSKK